MRPMKPWKCISSNSEVCMYTLIKRTQIYIVFRNYYFCSIVNIHSFVAKAAKKVQEK